MPPAVALDDETPEDLDALHSLLAEPLPVQRTGGLLEVGEREKRLH
jgi:hypothetical protein